VLRNTKLLQDVLIGCTGHRVIRDDQLPLHERLAVLKNEKLYKEEMNMKQNKNTQVLRCEAYCRQCTDHDAA
jgi:hypothetical protein